MKRNNFILLLILLLSTPYVFSQKLFTNTEVSKAYEKGTRTEIGIPGKNYWQNRGNYQIQVKFDPATNLLSGNETISYFNNSPDTLTELIIRLYPNLYKKGVKRLNAIDEKDLNEGVIIDSFRVNNEQISHFSDSKKAYQENTNLIIKPANYLLPHSENHLSVKWHYTVNTGSQERTGRVDSGSYFIAYFFPRVAVYDDIDGWDKWSYNGVQEFYNDFGNFDVDITVPGDYVVWATGARINPAENFSGQVLKKLKIASSSNDIVHIIEEKDYVDNHVLANQNTGTWKFTAANVTDFVFAISDHYLWDASSVLTDSGTGKRTLAGAAYNSLHEDYYDVARQAHQSVYLMSYYYPKYPFPFDYITIFDGTDQMEYPMMVNDNPTSSLKDAVQLTSHEIFHSYFPFYMGTNETQDAWMDEGWATIGESVISPLMGEPEDEVIFSKVRYEKISGTDKDIPLITNTKLYSDNAYYANSYGKGGICYYVLQNLLGDDLFFKSLHYYIDTWHGKHPGPYDFFYSINHASGKNLNWFWKKWFFDWTYPDLSINKVEKYRNGTKITIENKGGLPLPVFLEITASGKTTMLRSTAAVWETGKNLMVYNLNLPFDSISKIQLGNEFTPDKFKGDNTWAP